MVGSGDTSASHCGDAPTSNCGDAPTRRQVLAAAATVAGATLATACSGGSAAVRRTSPTAVRSGSRPSGPVGATAADWRALSRGVTGRVVRAGEDGYPRAHRLYDPRFDAVRPQAIVAAISPDDVSTAITFARRHGLPLALRSGGHSYLGASTGRGLVVDLRPMNRVSVGSGADAAVIEAGALLVDVYSELAGAGVSVPAGSCPTVGITGLALGGGVGVVARRFGLTCDRVSSFRVVTAAGDQLTADSRHHPDLYFALRGGGGSFAAVTAMTVRTHPAGGLGIFTLSWPWQAASRVLAAWQTWATSVPDELWSTCHLLSTASAGDPTVSVSGVWVGAASAAAPYLDRLAAAVDEGPTSRYVADRGYLDTMLLEAGCDHDTAAACHLAGTAPDATVGRTTFVAASDLFTHPLPTAAVTAAVEAVAARQRDPGLGVGGAAFDALGGAVARIAPGATAFPHRSALFGVQWSASWPVTDAGAQARNERSLAALRAATQRYADGAYSNYPTAGRLGAAAAYWGANLPRLRRIKRMWDPTDVFHQPQGIRPA